MATTHALVTPILLRLRCVSGCAGLRSLSVPIYSFSRSQTVAMSLDRCWAFFSDPRNLSMITPPELALIVRSDLAAEVYPGLMIRYTVTPLWKVRMTWLTEITQVQKPDYFVR